MAANLDGSAASGLRDEETAPVHIHVSGLCSRRIRCIRFQPEHRCCGDVRSFSWERGSCCACEKREPYPSSSFTYFSARTATRSCHEACHLVADVMRYRGCETCAALAVRSSTDGVFNGFMSRSEVLLRGLRQSRTIYAPPIYSLPLPNFMRGSLGSTKR